MMRISEKAGFRAFVDDTDLLASGELQIHSDMRSVTAYRLLTNCCNQPDQLSHTNCEAVRHLKWRMLVAYIKSGVFEIKDITQEDTGMAVLPIALYSEALAILGRAMHERPDVKWEIRGTGPHGVFESEAVRRVDRREDLAE